jgi:hypothetical protein
MNSLAVKGTLANIFLSQWKRTVIDPEDLERILGLPVVRSSDERPN